MIHGVYEEFLRDHLAIPVDPRRKDRKRTLPRRRHDPHRRGHGAGPQSHPGRHLALPRSEFLQSPEHLLHRPRRPGPARPHHLVGRFHPPDRHAHHGALRRRRPGPAAPRRHPTDRHPARSRRRRIRAKPSSPPARHSPKPSATRSYHGDAAARPCRYPRPQRRRQKMGVDQKRRADPHRDRPARHRDPQGLRPAPRPTGRRQGVSRQGGLHPPRQRNPRRDPPQSARARHRLP